MFTRFIVLVVAAVFSAGVVHAQQTKELTLWTHWAAEQIKRQYVEEAIAEFEKKNPGIKIKASWYEKNALYAALKTALRAGQAPDIFYAEPDQSEYYENGFLLDLADLNWANIEPWAKQAWDYKGKAYGLPLEAWTVELYYNKKLMDEIGVNVPESLQLSGDAFLDMVKKAKAKGIVPMSLGSGDRPFTGAHLTHEALLQKLGSDDYDRLLRGKLTWTDPRVIDTLKWLRALIDAGLLPTTFTSLKLGESHIYFHTKPGALTFLNGSWYTSRAFNAPDQGGQPVGFPLGIMRYPAVPGAVCPECRSLAIGGSYVINAETKYAKDAVAFLNTFATPEMGNKWLERVMVQTGIKSDVAKITGANAEYFKMLEASNKGAKYYFGIPIQVMQGKPKEVFTQVINMAFPAGTLDVDGVVKQMGTAY